MGFKCPVCKKDFGIKKNRFDKHIKNKHNGVANMCTEALTNAYDALAKLKEKK